MALITWRKHDNKKLSEHFSSNEFDCQCKNEDCIDQCISEDLLKKLEHVRVGIAQPLKITSGFRCAKHQQALREGGLQTASGKSQHEIGEAADVTANMPIDDLSKVCGRSFLAIGEAKTFIHVDTRGGMKRHWLYK